MKKSSWISSGIPTGIPLTNFCLDSSGDFPKNSSWDSFEIPKQSSCNFFMDFFKEFSSIHRKKKIVRGISGESTDEDF